MNNKEIISKLLNNWDNHINYLINNFSSLNNADAEDILQDIIYTFLKSKNRDDIISISSFIHKSLYNRAINSIKRKNELYSFDFSTLISKDTVENEVLNNEIMEFINRELNNMNEIYKEVWVATEFENVKFRALAKKLGVSINTLLSRKIRANELLKRKLIEHNYLRGE